MGINVAGIAYWNTELPLLDLMHMSGDWSLVRRDGGGPAAPAELDGQGWLRRLPEGAKARLPLAAGVHLPRGRWIVRHEGRGEIELAGRLRVTRRERGRLEAEVVAGDDLTVLQVTSLDTADPLRRIRVLRPGADTRPTGEIWDAGFVERWRGWAVLRFMDLMATNNSTLVRWDQRPRLDDRSFAPRGVPLEALIDLANRCGVAPWFCLPHAADDDFVRRFALLVRDRLDPRLAAHVEYSNETWNTVFEQARYVQRQDQERGQAGNPLAGRRWHGLRSRDVFRLCSEALGATRLVRVLATQGGNPWSTEPLLASGAARESDILAINPYVGMLAAPDGTPPSSEIARWPLERVFDHLRREVGHQARAMRDQRALAARHGLRLAAYEGGQHLVGVGEATNDESLTRLFAAAQHDERMGAVYRALFDAWEAAGGGLFCHYASVAQGSRWGHWGLLEHHDDDPAHRPKYRATLERMHRWKAS